MKQSLTEFIGTFFLVLVIGLSQGNALAIGLVLMAIVYAGGYISGANYNPAVSLALWVRGKLDKATLLKYWIVQLAGAAAAGLVVEQITQNPFLPISALPTAMLPVFIVEFLFTFVLCYTILQVATAKPTGGNPYFGLAIGAVLVAGITAGGPISGAVFNPAVMIGPALMHWSQSMSIVEGLLMYLIAQLLAGAAAAWIFKQTQVK